MRLLQPVKPPFCQQNGGRDVGSLVCVGSPGNLVGSGDNVMITERTHMKLTHLNERQEETE